MDDTLVTIIAIFLAAILMFIFPLMALADRNDDVTALTVQTATAEFVDEIRKTGKLTQGHLDNYRTTLAATGNSYDVELEFQILDENPGKKETEANPVVIGENVYYSQYEIQIEETLSTNGVYYLKEGDIVSAKAVKRSQSMYESLIGVFYKLIGNELVSIIGSSAGTVTVNGR